MCQNGKAKRFVMSSDKKSDVSREINLSIKVCGIVFVKEQHCVSTFFTRHSQT